MTPRAPDDRDFPLYQELHDPPLPRELENRLLACIALLRAEGAALAGVHRPDREVADRAVSAEAVEDLIRVGEDVGGLASSRKITDAIPFNVRKSGGVVWSTELTRRRAAVEGEIARLACDAFGIVAPVVLQSSGHFWYPPGSRMGWHTNARYPGLRLYLTHVVEPGSAFFRWRHPTTGEISTSPDSRWSLRTFRVTAEAPLWHAIRSETDRFSLGWIVRPWSPWHAITRTMRRVSPFDRI